MTTYVANDTAFNVVSGTSIATDSALNVASGDILVAHISFQDTSTTVSVSDTAGNTWTVETASNVSTHYDVVAYVLSSIANSSNIITASFGDSEQRRCIEVLQFRPTSGKTASIDTSNVATGTNASPNSGNITTTGDDEIVLGFMRNQFTTSLASSNIGGEAADGTYDSNEGRSATWYKLYAATKTNIAATIGISWAQWICRIVSFKLVASSTLTALPRRALDGPFYGSLKGSVR